MTRPADELRELRKKAERQLRREPMIPGLPDDRRMLIHELRVHQVELEMQNDSLRESQLELSLSRARYRALYDLAPVACLSLGEDTRIAEANLAACTLLGASSVSELLGERFSRFLAPEHSERLEHHRRELHALRSQCSSELSLRVGEHTRVVRVQSTWLDGPVGAQWLMAVIELPEPDSERVRRRSEVVEVPGSPLGRAIGVALVVESDRLVRSALRRQLQLIGCTVKEAESGEAALEMLQREREHAEVPRVLVSDIALPDVSAERFVLAARAIRPELHVLLVSPYAAGHPANTAARALATTVLTKPFGNDELRVGLYTALGFEPGANGAPSTGTGES